MRICLKSTQPIQRIEAKKNYKRVLCVKKLVFNMWFYCQVTKTICELSYMNFYLYFANVLIIHGEMLLNRFR